MRSTIRTVLFCGLSLLLASVVPASASLTPRAASIPIIDGPGCSEDWLDLAALPETADGTAGRFLAVWTETVPVWFDPDVTILAQSFEADGTPLGEPRKIETGSRAQRTRVAVNAAGRVLIAWYDRETGEVVVQFFGLDLEPLGTRRVLSQSIQVPYGLDVAVLANGGFGVLTARPNPVLWRFSPEGEQVDVTPLLPEGTPARSLDGLRLSAHGAEGAAAVWSVEGSDTFTVEARLFQPGGLSPLITVASFPSSLTFTSLEPPLPAIAGDSSGTVLVTWRGVMEERGTLVRVLLARSFGSDGAPLTGAFRLDGADDAFISPPDVVADAAGGFIAVWQAWLPPLRDSGFTLRRLSARGELAEPLRVRNALYNFEQPAVTIDGPGVGGAGEHLAIARQGGYDTGIPEEPCVRFGTMLGWTFDVATDRLSLQQGRFRVEVQWVGAPGQWGVGRPVVLTPDSGYFWFFGPDNVELMLKILDGRGINGHFWVFYASLSNVAYEVKVTDTVTGRVKTYHNASGELGNRADTAAFPAPADASALQAAKSGTVVVPKADEPGAGSCTDPALATTPRPGLCLGDRFEVAVDWNHPATPATGAGGSGHGVRLTDDSGYFWFFGPSNVELMIKVLDGRAVNGRFWVFYGALSNVEYTIHVRDTVTGQVRSYHNPAGRLASHADTAAFPLPE